MRDSSAHRSALCSQVRFHLAPPSPVRSEPLIAAGAPSDDPAAPQPLEVAAPQSSLALSLELQSARAAVAGGQFDAAKAVEEQLRKSFQTRCVVEETVAEGEGGRRPAPAAVVWVKGAAHPPPPLVRSQG